MLNERKLINMIMKYRIKVFKKNRNSFYIIDYYLNIDDNKKFSSLQ